MSLALPSPVTDARFADLCAVLGSREGVRLSDRKTFGSQTVKVNGRIFVMLTRGCLVVKLPAARIDALIAEGWGERLGAYRGCPMKEWLSVDPRHESDWQELAEESLALVANSNATRPRRRKE